MTDESTGRLTAATPSLAHLARLDALALAAAIWFLAKLLRYAFPPLFGTAQRTYGVSNTVLGTAFTALMLACAAMQFPSGALADRFGSVRVIGAGGHGYRPVRETYLVTVIPDVVGGGTLGAVRTASVAVGATAPAVVGFLSDAVGFGPTFDALVAVAVVALALLVVLTVLARR